MTIEELIESLTAVPPSAMVNVRIRKNVAFDGTHEDLYEFREATIEAVVYTFGAVYLQLDE